MTEKTWAIIPTNGRQFVHDCIDSLLPQVDGIVLVTNGEIADHKVLQPDPKVHVIADVYANLNISRWWNVGLDWVAYHMADWGESPTQPWNSLVVNDDVIACHNLVEKLSGEMRQSGAALAFPNQFDNHRAFHKEAKPIDLHHRITGYCFMLRGESGLRLDENLVWWYGDDDLDWRARTEGGSLLVPWCKVQHLAPNGTMVACPELHRQASQDRQTFINKWGKAPW